MVFDLFFYSQNDVYFTFISDWLVIFDYYYITIVVMSVQFNQLGT